MSNLFEELKRRKVFRVAAAYLVLGWVLIQVADTIAPMMNLPESAPRFILFLLILLFPVAVFLAWVFEIRPTDGEMPVEGSTSRGVLTVFGSVVVLGVAGYFLLWGRDDAPLGVAESATTVAEAPANMGLEAGSIAVLPFSDLSPDGDQEYFGDGIAEELLNVLASLDGLSVASKTSTFAFKNANRNIAQIADILGVAHIVEGSVRMSGSEVRITAQLIDTSADRHLWSDTYDKELTTDNIFAIQDEIANAIVSALRTELSLSLEGDISVAPLTENLDAYDLYLRAQQLSTVFSTESVRQQLLLLERAVDLDPSFSEGWAALAYQVTSLPTWDHSLEPEPYHRRAIELAEQALELAPSIVKAYRALESAHFSLYDWEAASDVVSRAQIHVPDYVQDPESLMGLGYLSRADDAAKKLAGGNSTPDYLYFLLHALYMQAMEQHEAAIVAFDEAIRRGYHGSAEENLAQSYREIGHLPVWTATMSAQWTESDPELLPLLTYMHDLLSAKPQGRALAVRRFLAAVREFGLDIDDLVVRGPLRGTRLPSDVAVAIGRSDAVVDRYWGNSPMFWMWNPSLRMFRQSDEFHQRVRETGMLDYWQKNGWPDLCRAKGDDDFECD